VGGEPQIDAPPPVPDRLPDEGFRELDVVLQAIHLPDDIVAQPETLEYLIKRRKTAGNDSGWHHPVLTEKIVSP
jgi:hypothetical protein